MYPHQKIFGNPQGDLVLNQPIPKAVLDGRKEGEYVIVESPDIAVPIPPVLH
jgi:nitrous oxidase accessory protein NosD